MTQIVLTRRSAAFGALAASVPRPSRSAVAAAPKLAVSSVIDAKLAAGVWQPGSCAQLGALVRKLNQAAHRPPTKEERNAAIEGLLRRRTLTDHLQASLVERATPIETEAQQTAAIVKTMLWLADLWQLPTTNPFLFWCRNGRIGQSGDFAVQHLRIVGNWKPKPHPPSPGALETVVLIRPSGILLLSSPAVSDAVPAVHQAGFQLLVAAYSALGELQDPPRPEDPPSVRQSRIVANISTIADSLPQLACGCAPALGKLEDFASFRNHHYSSQTLLPNLLSGAAGGIDCHSAP